MVDVGNVTILIFNVVLSIMLELSVAQRSVVVFSSEVNIVVLGMAAPAACTRFSDNYELKEELGK